MTTIDLTGAVAAALDIDPHYRQCPVPMSDCVFCQSVRDQIERIVLAAAPVITSAVWSSRPDHEDGLQVRQQWAARYSGLKPRLRVTEEQARALAHGWSGELLVQDVYSGAGEFRVVEDFSKPRKPTDG